MESAQSLPGHGPADARRTALAKLQAVNTALGSRIGIQPCESQNSEGPLRTLLKKCLRCCTELRDTELELAECERAVEKAEGSVWSVKTRRIAVRKDPPDRVRRPYPTLRTMRTVRWKLARTP